MQFFMLNFALRTLKDILNEIFIKEKISESFQ